MVKCAAMSKFHRASFKTQKVVGVQQGSQTKYPFNM